MSADQTAWLTRLELETANLRVALDFSFSTDGEAGAGLRMTRLLRTYWLMTGQFTEGRRWHRLAETADPGSADNSWAVFGAGVLAVQQGDFAAGRPLLARAAGLAAAAGDEDLAAHVTDARGMLAFYSGDLVAAQAEFEAALAVYERAGFGDPTALVTYSRLASVCLLTFELDRAVKLCEQCLRRCDESGEQWARGTALWTRGASRWLSGDNTTAIEDVLACLRIKEQLADLHTIAMSFDLLSVCLVATGDFERSAVLHGAGESLWTLLNAPVLMGPAYAEIRRSAADAARSSLGGERFDALAGHGFAMPLAAALAVAKGDAPAAPAGEPGNEVKPLTRREKEIAGLVADGLGNREIAERLYLSKRTVDSHLEHIFAKLGFSSRTQLANWILERKKPV
jgi:non-specific serine/threonine protein kinase